jgi:hypothetical protein
MAESSAVTKSKDWWKSKTIWSGIVAVILAAYSTAASTFGLPVVPEWVFAILGAFGIYSRANATALIK